MEERFIYLKKLNWEELISSVVFEKNNYELVFDTSGYIEVYDKITKIRIIEGRVNSVKGLIILLEKLDYK